MVKASSSGASVTVSSDGITILPIDVPLQGFTVADGERCASQASSKLQVVRLDENQLYNSLLPQ